jgi:two-component system OmpR family response regulator
MTMRILLIDDDEQLGEPLAAYVARFEMQLIHATRPSAGLAQLRQGGFDAAILDVMLPEMDGFALCRTIRKESDIPLIMLTARGDVMDRVVGLELGADDYLPKPFEPRELVARLQTVLRRRQPGSSGASFAASNVSGVSADGRLHFEGLTVDATTRSVQCLGQSIELTSTEFDLLHLLAREPGKVFNRDDILNQLRGHDADLYTRAVDIVVSRLRKKLEPLDAIKTLRNAGYALALRAQQPALNTAPPHA